MGEPVDVGRLAAGYLTTQLVGVAAALGIADLLASGPKTAAALAAATETDGDALFRVLRALAALGVMGQREGDLFAENEATVQLRRGAPAHALAVSYVERWWWTAAGGLLETVRTGATAFVATHGSGLFDYLAAHPAAAAVFNANMTGMTTAQAREIAAAYAFPSGGLVVDVAGGQGALLTAIVTAHPGLRGLLFDRPAVVEGAVLPPGCEAVGGSFFDGIPPGGDVYVLKDILHDWDDETAAGILRACRDALRPGSRLLVIERVIPPGDAPAAGKLVDVVMLLLTGGRERTRDEYATLAGRADLEILAITDVADTNLIELERKVR